MHFADPLSSYPSFKQLIELRVEQWFKFGLHLGLTEDQLEVIRKNQNPTAVTLVAAKTKNISMKWKQVVEGLLRIGDYQLAKSVCSKYGMLW